MPRTDPGRHRRPMSQNVLPGEFHLRTHDRRLGDGERGYVLNPQFDPSDPYTAFWVMGEGQPDVLPQEAGYNNWWLTGGYSPLGFGRSFGYFGHSMKENILRRLNSLELAHTGRFGVPPGLPHDPRDPTGYLVLADWLEENFPDNLGLTRRGHHPYEELRDIGQWRLDHPVSDYVPRSATPPIQTTNEIIHPDDVDPNDPEVQRRAREIRGYGSPHDPTEYGRLPPDLLRNYFVQQAEGGVYNPNNLNDRIFLDHLREDPWNDPRYRLVEHDLALRGEGESGSSFSHNLRDLIGSYFPEDVSPDYDYDRSLKFGLGDGTLFDLIPVYHPQTARAAPTTVFQTHWHPTGSDYQSLGYIDVLTPSELIAMLNEMGHSVGDNRRLWNHILPQLPDPTLESRGGAPTEYGRLPPDILKSYFDQQDEGGAFNPNNLNDRIFLDHLREDPWNDPRYRLVERDLALRDHSTGSIFHNNLDRMIRSYFPKGVRPEYDYRPGSRVSLDLGDGTRFSIVPVYAGGTGRAVPAGLFHTHWASPNSGSGYAGVLTPSEIVEMLRGIDYPVPSRLWNHILPQLPDPTLESRGRTPTEYGRLPLDILKNYFDQHVAGGVLDQNHISDRIFVDQLQEDPWRDPRYRLVEQDLALRGNTMSDYHNNLDDLIRSYFPEGHDYGENMYFDAGDGTHFAVLPIHTKGTNTAPPAKMFHTHWGPAPPTAVSGYTGLLTPSEIIHMLQEIGCPVPPLLWDQILPQLPDPTLESRGGAPTEYGRLPPDLLRNFFDQQTAGVAVDQNLLSDQNQISDRVFVDQLQEDPWRDPRYRIVEQHVDLLGDDWYEFQRNMNNLIQTYFPEDVRPEYDYRPGSHVSLDLGDGTGFRIVPVYAEGTNHAVPAGVFQTAWHSLPTRNGSGYVGVLTPSEILNMLRAINQPVPPELWNHILPPLPDPNEPDEPDEYPPLVFYGRNPTEYGDYENFLNSISENPADITGHLALADRIREDRGEGTQDEAFRRLMAEWVRNRTEQGGHNIATSGPVRVRRMRFPGPGFPEFEDPYQIRTYHGAGLGGYAVGAYGPYISPEGAYWDWYHNDYILGRQAQVLDFLRGTVDPEIAESLQPMIDAQDDNYWPTRSEFLYPHERLLTGVDWLGDENLHVDPGDWTQVERILRQRFNRIGRFADDSAPTRYSDQEYLRHLERDSTRVEPPDYWAQPWPAAQYMDLPPRLVAAVPVLETAEPEVYPFENPEYYAQSGYAPVRYNHPGSREQLVANPYDPLFLQISADWFDENDDPDEAIFRRAVANSDWLRGRLEMPWVPPQRGVTTHLGTMLPTYGDWFQAGPHPFNWPIIENWEGGQGGYNAIPFHRPFNPVYPHMPERWSWATNVESLHGASPQRMAWELGITPDDPRVGAEMHRRLLDHYRRMLRPLTAPERAYADIEQFNANPENWPGILDIARERMRRFDHYGNPSVPTEYRLNDYREHPHWNKLAFLGWDPNDPNLPRMLETHRTGDYPTPGLWNHRNPRPEPHAPTYGDDDAAGEYARYSLRYGLEDQLAGFHAALREEPTDATGRLAMADLLQEHGHNPNEEAFQRKLATWLQERTAPEWQPSGWSTNMLNSTPIMRALDPHDRMGNDRYYKPYYQQLSNGEILPIHGAYPYLRTGHGIRDWQWLHNGDFGRTLAATDVDRLREFLGAAPGATMEDMATENMQHNQGILSEAERIAVGLHGLPVGPWGKTEEHQTLWDNIEEFLRRRHRRGVERLGSDSAPVQYGFDEDITGFFRENPAHIWRPYPEIGEATGRWALGDYLQDNNRDWQARLVRDPRRFIIPDSLGIYDAGLFADPKTAGKLSMGHVPQLMRHYLTHDFANNEWTHYPADIQADWHPTTLHWRPETLAALRGDSKILQRRSGAPTGWGWDHVIQEWINRRNGRNYTGRVTHPLYPHLEEFLDEHASDFGPYTMDTDPLYRLRGPYEAPYIPPEDIRRFDEPGTYGGDSPLPYHDLTAHKAREILHDGTVHGHPLTPKQRRYMGAVAGGNNRYGSDSGPTNYGDEEMLRSAILQSPWDVGLQGALADELHGLYGEDDPRARFQRQIHEWLPQRFEGFSTAGYAMPFTVRDQRDFLYGPNEFDQPWRLPRGYGTHPEIAYFDMLQPAMTSSGLFWAFPGSGPGFDVSPDSIGEHLGPGTPEELRTKFPRWFAKTPGMAGRALTPVENTYLREPINPKTDPGIWPELHELLRERFQLGHRFATDATPTRYDDMNFAHPHPWQKYPEPRPTMYPPGQSRPVEYGDEEMLRAAIAQNPWDVSLHGALADWHDEFMPGSEEAAFRQAVHKWLPTRLNHVMQVGMDNRGFQIGPHGSEPFTVRTWGSNPGGILPVNLREYQPWINNYPGGGGQIKWQSRNMGGFQPAWAEQVADWFNLPHGLVRELGQDALSPNQTTEAFHNRALSNPESAYLGFGVDDSPYSLHDNSDPALWPELERILRMRQHRGQQFAGDRAPTAYGDEEMLRSAILQSPWDVSLHGALADWNEEFRPGSEEAAFRQAVHKWLPTRLNHVMQVGMGPNNWTIGPHGSEPFTLRTWDPTGKLDSFGRFDPMEVPPVRQLIPRQGPTGIIHWHTGDFHNPAWPEQVADWFGLPHSDVIYHGQNILPPLQRTLDHFHRRLNDAERSYLGFAVDDSPYSLHDNSDPALWPELEQILRMRQHRGQQFAAGESPTAYADWNEEDFRERILDNPLEETPHHAFTDWLREQGREGHADFQSGLWRWIADVRDNPLEVEWTHNNPNASNEWLRSDPRHMAFLTSLTSLHGSQMYPLRPSNERWHGGSHMQVARPATGGRPFWWREPGAHDLFGWWRTPELAMESLHFDPAHPDYPADLATAVNNRGRMTENLNAAERIYAGLSPVSRLNRKTYPRVEELLRHMWGRGRRFDSGGEPVHYGDEETFRHQIARNPADLITQRVYRDWLMEQGSERQNDADFREELADWTEGRLGQPGYGIGPEGFWHGEYRPMPAGERTGRDAYILPVHRTVNPTGPHTRTYPHGVGAILYPHIDRLNAHYDPGEIPRWIRRFPLSPQENPETGPHWFWRDPTSNLEVAGIGDNEPPNDVEWRNDTQQFWASLGGGEPWTRSPDSHWQTGLRTPADSENWIGGGIADPGWRPSGTQLGILDNRDRPLTAAEMVATGILPFENVSPHRWQQIERFLRDRFDRGQDL
jgi:uncharacterized protein (TIGR02996 family)